MGIRLVRKFSSLTILILILPIFSASFPSVLALDEFVDDYVNEDYVSAKVLTVRNTTYDCMEIDGQPALTLTDSVVQLKEHNLYSSPSYNPIYVYSEIDGGENVRTSSNDPSMGVGYFMLVVDRGWFDGKYLRYNWDGACEFKKSFAHAFIFDGTYDRSNATQFPNGANKLLMGSGQLQHLQSIGEVYSFAGTYDFLVNVSLGVMVNVTIFWQCNDAWNTIYDNVDLNWVQINTDAGGAGNLFTEQVNGGMTMEVTGTYNDYGRVDSLTLPYAEGGYYVDGSYTTTEVLSGLSDNSVVLLTNISLPGIATATAQFSNDNATWVDHDGVAGSDDLPAGFEAINLIDLSYDTLYIRFNLSRGGIQLTPRIYQIRVITNDTVAGNGAVNYPVIDIIELNTTVAGDGCGVTGDFSDVEGLSGYIFWENATNPPVGTYAAWAVLVGTTDTILVNITLPSDGTVVGIRFDVNDTDGNWNNETLVLFPSAQEDVPQSNFPVIDFIELNSTVAGEVANVTGTFSDVEGLSGEIFWNNVTNPPVGVNTTWSALTGTSDSAGYNITLPTADTKVGVGYYVNDTDGSWAFEPIVIFPTAAVGGNPDGGGNPSGWGVLTLVGIFLVAVIMIGVKKKW